MVMDVDSVIAALHEKNLRLEAALAPFVKAAEVVETDEDDDYSLSGSSARFALTIGHLRAARKAVGDP